VSRTPGRQSHKCVILYPGWRQDGEKPSRRTDREAIIASLDAAGVVDSSSLVYIEEEIEAWLLADERAIGAFLSTRLTAIRINRIKYPDTVTKPKVRLNEIFQEHARRPYSDRIHGKP
jgi:hypothetical protein